MKSLFAVVILGLCSLVTQAQLTTNIQFRATVAIAGAGGSTNQTTLTLLFNGGAKQRAAIEALLWFYAKQVSNGETNMLDQWLANIWVGDRLREFVRNKAQEDFAQLASDVTVVLQTKPEDITAAELQALQDVAAKKDTP